MHSARYAKRISIRPQVTPENEKYYANSWLMRMGFGGSEHKEMRHTPVSYTHLGNLTLILRNDPRLKDIAYNIHRSGIDIHCDPEGKTTLPLSLIHI